MKIAAINNVFLRVHEGRDAEADIWFIHGFGETGLSFQEAFSSVLAERYNLFVPDFPGFGVTPFREDCSSVQDAARLALDLIEKCSKDRSIGVVAHSLGGIIGTWVCRELKSRVLGYVSIEGNLTKPDTFFSGLASKASSPEEFFSFFEKKIRQEMGEDPSLLRYYAGLRFHDPRALIAWGRSGVEATGETRGGEEFAALACRKVYFWGDKSTAPETQEFIKKRSLPNRCFKGSGHWPMIERPEECYGAILDFLG